MANRPKKNIESGIQSLDLLVKVEVLNIFSENSLEALQERYLDPNCLSYFLKLPLWLMGGFFTTQDVSSEDIQ